MHIEKYRLVNTSLGVETGFSFSVLHIFVSIFTMSMHCFLSVEDVFKVKVKVAQFCLTLCDPMDCSLPGSSVCGILQASILEWVAISFSKPTY